jgi:hypothetical protein
LGFFLDSRHPSQHDSHHQEDRDGHASDDQNQCKKRAGAELRIEPEADTERNKDDDECDASDLS